MYYVYLLLSKKDKQLYIGYTNDLKRRVAEHNAGLSSATRHRRPLMLIYYEAYLDWPDAKNREKYLKGGNGRKQIKIQLKSILNRIKYKNLKSPCALTEKSKPKN